MITQERLKELVTYNESTGMFKAKRLGYFDKFDEAVLVARQARQDAFGEFFYI